jgi:hypothetical protein
MISSSRQTNAETISKQSDSHFKHRHLQGSLESQKGGKDDDVDDDCRSSVVDEGNGRRDHPESGSEVDQD